MAERQLDCEIIDLTPIEAQRLLDGNTRNRSLRPDYVRQLAAAMERGEWMINGEPVQLAEDGTLLNGQHRLSAVVESGVTVPMLLVRGLPTTTQKTMDVGTRRTLSDVLSLHGQRDTTNLGAMLGLLYRYRNEARLDYASRTAPTITEALELLRKEPRIPEALLAARKVCRVTRMRVSVAALMLYLFEEVDPGEGQRFFDALENPSREERGSTVLALRSLLERVHTERNFGFSTYVLSALTIKAFNAWREGRRVEILAFKPGGAKPEPFPKILTRAELGGSSAASLSQ
jgi:hypothetical protein